VDAFRRQDHRKRRRIGERSDERSGAPDIGTLCDGAGHPERREREAEPSRKTAEDPILSVLIVQKEEGQEHSCTGAGAWAARKDDPRCNDEGEKQRLDNLRRDEHSDQRHGHAENDAVCVGLVLKHLVGDGIVGQRSARGIAMKRKDRRSGVVGLQQRIKKRLVVSVIPAQEPLKEYGSEKKGARQVNPVERVPRFHRSEGALSARTQGEGHSADSPSETLVSDLEHRKKSFVEAGRRTQRG
jgi:hypothetical protein